MLILGYTVPACNYRQGDCESQESLGYTVRLHYGTNKRKPHPGDVLIGRLLPSYAQGLVFAPAQLKQAVVVFARDSRERTGPNVILSYTVSSRSV